MERLLAERVRLPRTTLLFDLFARELRKAGVPLVRATLHTPQLHPQLAARTILWDLEAGGAIELGREHGVRESPMFQRSPVKPIYEGAPPIRRRLADPDCPMDFPVLNDLRGRGLTDYWIGPLPFATGAQNATSIATNQPDGFSDLDLAVVEAALPAFGAVLELRHTRQTARVLLDTYLGHATGGRVLNGVIKRGDGEVVHAVLWYCDLRDFTSLSGSLPLDQVIGLLNAYYDCVAAAVEQRGGEILKFIGDAMLAIFPCRAEPNEACSAADSACDAAEQAIANLASANESRIAANQAPIRCGIAIHIGDVMYGNIGSANRLDFTVIGPAVNLVSRLETLTRRADHPLVVSPDIARLAHREFRSLGKHALKGIQQPQEAFTLA